MQPNCSELVYLCTHPGCSCYFKSIKGRTKHVWTFHVVFSLPSPSSSLLSEPESENGILLDDNRRENRAVSQDNAHDDEWEPESFRDEGT